MEASSTPESPAGGIPEGMSKNQWKKLLKLQRIEQGRAEWKKKQKEKEKEKRKKRKAEGLQPIATLVKKYKTSDPEASPIQVAIHLGYEHLMCDLDIKMLMKQCQRCYAANRRAQSPLQLSFTSFGGRCKQRLEESTQDGYKKWDVQFKAGDYIEEFGSDNVVFLTSESPNILKDFSPGKVYVIGGLVDHNYHKGYCYQDTVSKGVGHAQLPITDYLTLNSRKVLAVNHVYEIIVAYVQCHDWRQSFLQVIPQRKQANTISVKKSSTSPLPTKDSSTSGATESDRLEQSSCTNSIQSPTFPSSSLSEINTTTSTTTSTSTSSSSSSSSSTTSSSSTSSTTTFSSSSSSTTSTTSSHTNVAAVSCSSTLSLLTTTATAVEGDMQLE